MPRLHHLADAKPIDFYDCFSLGRKAGADLHREGKINLFGHHQIGLPDRCNMQVAGQMVFDTAYIQNVYARTNIPVLAAPEDMKPKDVNWAIHLMSAVKDFAHSTQVTLVLGSMPLRQWPLSTLLDRKHGDRPADDIPVGEAEAYFADLAKFIFRELNHGANEVEDQRIAAEVESLWHKMIPAARESWLGAARAVHRRFKSPQLLIVPPRANVSVVVTIEQKSLAKLLELMPQDVAPEPLMWIHLEGFSRRDVC